MALDSPNSSNLEQLALKGLKVLWLMLGCMHCAGAEEVHRPIEAWPSRPPTRYSVVLLMSNLCVASKCEAMLLIGDL